MNVGDGVASPMGEDDFAQALREVQGRLAALSLRLAPAGVAPEDLLQNTLERAWSRRDTFRRESELFTWAYRIMVNRSRDLARRSGRTVALSESEGHAVSGPPEEAVERGEVAAQVRRALSALSETDRSVLSMKDGEEWSTAQVAAMIGSSEATTSRRLHRARRRLAAAVVAAELDHSGVSAGADCAGTRAQALLYLEDALPPEATSQVEDHLGSCKACPPVLQALQTIHAAILDGRLGTSELSDVKSLLRVHGAPTARQLDGRDVPGPNRGAG